ncbi:hypothetical protein [Bdellovibrio svalbardensis]|uniref:Uncharacterized protein n=1 Tax=Bdellovibrio svalbardensis TaxID=2972972 RepID=A0ABT6DKE4_9BACT|nr:hypothetical protein [Bdellovibrio svalbardensis]MDG0816379.1 hypothetical protein [Bdellovibrio svalbardensis]
MHLSRKLIFLLLLSTFSREGFAAGAEETRLLGFAEHQNNGKQFDKARAQGERGYLEESEQWENQRQRELADYKKSKKSKEMDDDGPEFKADALAKKQFDVEYQQTRKEFIEKKSQEEKLSRADKKLPTEAQELGLDMERPRYEYRKRAAFGGKPKFGSAAAAAGGSSYGGGSGGSSFPPPPTFDDFSGGGGGYVPAPNLPEDFGDVPPPPPPPPPGFGEDTFGGGYGTDFAPPPPPPPPFGEDSGDF